jgi:endonuclease/exonuclease/phosphatase family metal-dependent hydrolase
MSLYFIRSVCHFIVFALIAVVVSSCRHERVLGPSKALALREDGLLELRVMSFNLRYENTDDLASRSWQKRIVDIVKMLYREKPVILCVQEALHGQAADLWASLPDYEFFGIGRDDGKRAGEYSGIFYQRDRFEVDGTDRGTFWLSDTPEVVGSKTWGNEIPRVAAWLRLTDRTCGCSFYVFNTHWDHRNQTSREKAAMLIAKRIDARKHQDEPVLLLGDFNSVGTNPAVGYLTGKKGLLAGSEHQWKHGMFDTFQVLHADQKNRRTLHFWTDSTEGNLKVDHILASKGVTVESAEIISADQPMLSDHFPVLSQVDFPQR